ncbi:Rrf2 family transcriptional regulator [Kutzneria viridogrisea]|uniref:Rrf2 family protein n=1 Tax=Kutzneria viridogrisea TaxID=47990 RepID=A0ABR6BUN0_9PSEU|nr:Rrf2 family protein [Kutzneria viridogrisea]
MAGSTNTQFAVAVHVLTYLAGVTDAHAVSSDELSKSANVNPVYVRRVLGPLRRAGLVRSRSGVNGGWELAVDARQITLEQVWRPLQGTQPVLGLHGPDPTCATGRNVQKALTALDRTVADAVATSLKRFTVHDILDGQPEAAQSIPMTGG